MSPRAAAAPKGAAALASSPAAYPTTRGANSEMQNGVRPAASLGASSTDRETARAVQRYSPA
eukprot:CAMPEP_0203966602 /NCGR_PEP_ID=MMETSP0359-20131031/95785_1 /ASSEMBLY_ACC=CAM_ASM_000338 /TAXON_ID=268821 /ORGANISM="Scrippsiella Hangoei, Strain SHTV-5" /LENGTH=61 /DNA_ID=CAMNT_0050904041 /DNA_START=13 /DNA_END=195 /DNA_ORIENTATION=-